MPAAAGYMLAFLMVGPVALCYCELGTMMPVAGGGAAYAYRAFGSKLSFLSGWLAFGGFVTILPWEAIFVTDILSYAFPGIVFGDPLYEILGAPVYPVTILVGTICSVLLYLLNRAGAKSSSRFQQISCLLMILTGFVAVIFAIAGGDTANLEPVYENVGEGSSHSTFLGGAFSVMVAAAFFLSGFETIPQAIEEGGADRKRIGKMVVLSVGAACVFYAVILIALGMGMPWLEFIRLDSPSGAKIFLQMYDGGIGYIPYACVMLGALGGLLTTWNGFMMATPRLLMGMARSRMVPSALAGQDENGVPRKALAICFAFSFAGPLLGIGFVDYLTSFSGACFMLSWIITCASFIELRRSCPDDPRPYKLANGILVALWAVCFTGFSLVITFVPGTPCYMGTLPSLLFAVWISIGIFLFVLNRRNRESISEEKRFEEVFARGDRSIDDSKD